MTANVLAQPIVGKSVPQFAWATKESISLSQITAPAAATQVFLNLFYDNGEGGQCLVRIPTDDWR